mgnify:CR=1 FL=1
MATAERVSMKRAASRKVINAKAVTDNQMQSLSMWTSSVSEPVKWPTLHLVAFVACAWTRVNPDSI